MASSIAGHVHCDNTLPDVLSGEGDGAGRGTWEATPVFTK